LHIVGGGPLFLEIKELISKYSLEKNVKMYGHVENVHQIMSRFDVFVLTSISEGFGLVMLEAMIHSLPIISSDIDTLKEVVGESNALFFKATNQLSLSQKMDEMNSIDIRIKFAEKSVVRLKHFDIQNTENQHEKLYTLD
jgi:glycosyltransferase involved in cell wall biosynthesis